MKKDTVSTEPPDYAVTDGLYTLIKNYETGLYLQPVYDSSAPNNYVLSYGEPTGYGIQQWQILTKYTVDGGYYYKIKNVALNMVIEIENKIPVIGNRAILVPESEPNKAQEFSLDILGGNTYTFRTRCSGNFLALGLGSPGISQKRVELSYAPYFTLEPLNKYWDLFYENMSGTIDNTILDYYIDTIGGDSIGSAAITVDQVLSAVSNWNNVAGGVTLRRVYLAGSADVIIRSRNDGILRWGIAEPESVFGYNSEWATCTVYINSYNGTEDNYTPVSTLTPDQKQKLVCHELGHALKLQHPYGEGADGSVVYSVMNQGAFGDYKVYFSPSPYDTRTLKNKW